MNFLYYMISSSILILLILMIRTLFRKKLSPPVIYALWLIPLIRLLIPFNTWEFSPFGASAEMISATKAFVSDLFYDEDFSEEIMSQSEILPEKESITDSPVKIYDRVVPKVDTNKKENLPAASSNIVSQTQSMLKLSLISCWTFGSAIIGIYVFIQNRKLYQYMQSLEYIEIYNGLPVYSSDQLKTSCLAGIICPKIIITNEMLKDKTLCDCILQHESMHYRQKDHVWKLFKILPCIIFWWNPLIWIAAKCADEDAELACDAKVLKGQSSEQRKIYGYSLLKLLETAEYSKGNLYMAASISGSKKSMQKRITEIASHTKTRKTILVPILAALAVLFIIGCGAPSSKSWIKMSDWKVRDSEEVIFHEAEYSYSLKEDSFQTMLIYYECYEYGKLFERNVLSYGEIDKFQDSILLRNESNKYVQNKQFTLEMNGIGISMQSPAIYSTEGAYAVNTLHAENNILEVVPGDDLILMAYYFSNEEDQESLKTFDCRILSEYTEEKIEDTLKEHYVVSFIRLILSDKPSEVLCNEMTEREFPTAGENTNAQQLAAAWADAFVNRNAAVLSELSTEKAKQQLIDSSMMDETGADFGWSSPWPMFTEQHYRIIKGDSRGVEILYYATDSTPHVTVWQEKLEFEKINNVMKVSSWQIHWCDEISSIEDFRIAYPLKEIAGTQMDYYTNGLGEALNNNAMLNSSKFYLPLFDAGTAALELLNLSKDYSQVQYTTEEQGEEIIVHLKFLNNDGSVSSTDVTMWQPYGKEGIWIPK